MIARKHRSVMKMDSKEVLSIKHISFFAMKRESWGRAGVDKLKEVEIKEKNNGGKELLNSHLRLSLL